MTGVITPNKNQVAWQKAEIGALLHYDLSVFEKRHYNQQKNRERLYDSNIFNPMELDTDNWIQCAKSMGAKFAIITASHETGFRLWRSEVNPFSVANVSWAGGTRDIVGEFIASCEKFGLKPAVYMGTRWNGQLGIHDFKVTDRSPLTQEEYNALIEKEVEEICSMYGDLFELWFDGGASGPEEGGPDILPIFTKYQKNCIFYHNHQRADVRWGGTESGSVPYPCWATIPYKSVSNTGWRKDISPKLFYLLKHGDPKGQYYSPAMADPPLRSHEWVWNEGDDHKVKSLKKLKNIYYTSVGHNATLIVGLTPDKRGLIPAVDKRRCREFGSFLQSFYASEIDGFQQTVESPQQISLKFPKITTFNAIMLQEDITRGERIRSFVVEYKKKRRWKPLFQGTLIGHKLIIRTRPKKCTEIRLRIIEAIQEPLVSNFALFNII